MHPYFSIGNNQTILNKPIIALQNGELLYSVGKHFAIYNIKTKEQSFIFKKTELNNILAVNFINQRQYCLIGISLESTILTMPVVRVYQYRLKKVIDLKHIHLPPQSQITQLAFAKNENILFTFSFNKNINKGMFSIWNIFDEDLKLTYIIDHDIQYLETCYLSQKAVCYIHNNKVKILNYKHKKNLAKERYIHFSKQKNNQNLSKSLSLISLSSDTSDLNLNIENKSDESSKTDNRSETITEIISEKLKEDSIKDENRIKISPVTDNEKESEELKSNAKIEINKNLVGKEESETFKRISLKNLKYDKLKFYYYDNKTDFVFLAYTKSIYFYLKSNLIQEIKLDIFKHSKFKDKNLKKDYEISSIISFNNILLVGVTKYPIILVYSFDPKTNFTLFNEIVFNIKFIYQKIISFSVSFDKSLVGIAILQSQINTADPENTEINNTCIELAYIETSILEAVKYSPESFKFLNPFGTPAKKILSIALCENKDILGILSADRLVKIIDYSTEDKELNSTYLIRRGLSLDIHPSGNQCTIGFNEGLKVFFLSEGEFKEAFESYDKQCICVKYSKRGDMLATSSCNNLIIYDPFSLEKIMFLQAHAAPIKFLLWRGVDSVLLTSCNNGNIYCWDVRSWEKKFEYFLNDKNKKILAIDYDAEFDLLVYSTSDMKLSLIHDKGNIEIFSYNLKPTLITSLLIDKDYKVLLAGTDSGDCMMFLWPLQLYQNKLEYLSTPYHSGPINQMRITCDKNYLITASDDSTIYFSYLRYFNEDVNKRKSQQKESNQEFDEYEEDDIELADFEDDSDFIKKKIQETILKISDFTLISNEQMNRMKGNIKDCDFHIQNIKNEIEDQQENFKKEHNKEKTKLENEKKIIIKNQKEDLSKFLNEEKSKHNEFLKRKETKENNFKKMVLQLEESHEQKLLNLYQENDEINKNFIELTESLTLESIELEKKHTKELYILEHQYYKRISKTKEDYENSLNNLKQDQFKFNETINQLEEEYNKELKKKEEDLGGLWINEEKTATDLKSLNTKLVKERQKNKDKKVRLDDLIDDASKQNNMLNEELKVFKDKSKTMQEQLLIQERNINDKEVFLKKHRTKNNYLQNNKKVYDSLVKSLENEHNHLLNYFIDISNKLKIVHKRLIDEAESNKNLVLQKNHLFENLKNNKELLTKKEFQFKVIKKKIDNLIRDMYKVIDNFNLKPGTLKNEFLNTFSNKDLFPNYKNILKKTIQKKQPKKNGLLPSIENKSYKNYEIIETNQTDETQNKNNTFKEELERLKYVYQTKLEKTRKTYYKLNKERFKNFEEVQDKGKDLINKCTSLKNKRIQLYQQLYEAKNCVDNIVKEFNLHNVVSKKNNKSIKGLKKIKVDNELPFCKYIKNKENKGKNERTKKNSFKLPISSNLIFKKAMSIVKKNKINKNKKF